MTLCTRSSGMPAASEAADQCVPRRRAGQARIDEGEAALVLQRIAVDVAEPGHGDRQLHAKDAGRDLGDLFAGWFLLLTPRSVHRVTILAGSNFCAVRRSGGSGRGRSGGRLRGRRGGRGRHRDEHALAVVAQLAHALADVVEGAVARRSSSAARLAPPGTSAAPAPSRSTRPPSGSGASPRSRAGRRPGSAGRCRWSCRTAAPSTRSGACSLMNASVCAPASASVIVDARIASRRPDFVCMLTTNGSMPARASSGWWTTRSGPSATISSSSSVTSVAISTITSLGRVEPGHLEVHPHQHRRRNLGLAYAPRCSTLPVVRLDPELPLPAYARAGDAGLDLRGPRRRRAGPVRRPGAGADRHRRGSPRGPRRVRAAPQRLGPPPRRHGAQRARPDRRRLPRRAPGGPRQHRCQ